jgi:hypothetical protein
MFLQLSQSLSQREPSFRRWFLLQLHGEKHSRDRSGPLSMAAYRGITNPYDMTEVRGRSFLVLPVIQQASHISPGPTHTLACSK